MSRKNHLDPKEVERIINDHLQALRLIKGEQVADQTDLYYRKGWFYIRPAGMKTDALAHPFRPDEIENLTALLWKQISPRDSDSDGEVDEAT